MLFRSVVIRDVTDRNREEELTRKADRLSVMGQLAAGVAHELRNPLTTVKGFVQLIRSKPASLKSYYLDLIMEEMERIEYFIKELLVLAKPQALKMDNRSPAVMIGDAVASLAPMAEESGVAIECRLPQGLPTVRCEEAQLKQVFLNVIQNAIEAMPDGGTVRIEGHATDRGEVVVTVADEGAGMPPERLSRLGEPFYTTKEKGTGLGLMLSLKIMAEHDGTLAFESGTGGTTVTVTLPAG